MKNFAVIENNKVINVIVADSKTLAEELTGKLCIEDTPENPIGINYTYDGVNFIKPQPYPSWILDSEYNWQPPVVYPTVEANSDVFYDWDESTISWKAISTIKE